MSNPRSGTCTRLHKRSRKAAKKYGFRSGAYKQARRNLVEALRQFMRHRSDDYRIVVTESAVEIMPRNRWVRSYAPVNHLTCQFEVKLFPKLSP